MSVGFNFPKNKSISVVKHKTLEPMSKSRSPKIPGLRESPWGSRFPFASFLVLFLLSEIRHSHGRAGCLGSRMFFLGFNTQMWSIVNWIPAQNFEFSFPKANQFQRCFRYRSSESLHSKWQGITFHLKQQEFSIQQLQLERNKQDFSEFAHKLLFWSQRLYSTGHISLVLHCSGTTCLLMLCVT